MKPLKNLLNPFSLVTLLALCVSLIGCGGDKKDDSTASGTSGSAMSGTKKSDAETVAPSSGEAIIGDTSKDADLTKAAQEKIDADAALKTAGIKAEAKGGQVELTGTVKTVADKDKAEAAVLEAIKPFSALSAGVVNSLLVEDPQDPEATKK